MTSNQIAIAFIAGRLISYFMRLLSASSLWFDVNNISNFILNALGMFSLVFLRIKQTDKEIELYSSLLELLYSIYEGSSRITRYNYR